MHFRCTQEQELRSKDRIMANREVLLLRQWITAMYWAITTMT